MYVVGGWRGRSSSCLCGVDLDAVVWVSAAGVDAFVRNTYVSGGNLVQRASRRLGSVMQLGAPTLASPSRRISSRAFSSLSEAGGSGTPSFRVRRSRVRAPSSFSNGGEAGGIVPRALSPFGTGTGLGASASFSSLVPPAASCAQLADRAGAVASPPPAMLSLDAVSTFLSFVPILDGLNPIELNVVAGNLERTTFSKGDTVIEKGTLLNELIMVIDGSLESVGGQKDDMIYERGDFVGAHALIKTWQCNCKVIAVEDTAVLLLRRKTFDRLLKRFESALVASARSISGMSAGASGDDKTKTTIAAMQQDLAGTVTRREYIDILRTPTNIEFLKMISSAPVGEVVAQPTAEQEEHDRDQTLKDHLREEVIILNDTPAPLGTEALFTAARELLTAQIHRKITLPATDGAGEKMGAAEEEQIAWNILKHSSRTSHGGDAYAMIQTLFSKPGHIVITPALAHEAPTEIHIFSAQQIFVKAFNSFRACKFSSRNEEPRVWCHFHTISRKELCITQEGSAALRQVSNSLSIAVDEEPFETADQARSALAFRRVLRHGLALHEVDTASRTASLAVPREALAGNASIWANPSPRQMHLSEDGVEGVVGGAMQLRFHQSTEEADATAREMESMVVAAPAWAVDLGLIDGIKLVTKVSKDVRNPYLYDVILTSTHSTHASGVILTLTVSSAEEKSWLALGFASLIRTCKFRMGKGEEDVDDDMECLFLDLSESSLAYEKESVKGRSTSVEDQWSDAELQRSLERANQRLEYEAEKQTRSEHVKVLLGSVRHFEKVVDVPDTIHRSLPKGLKSSDHGQKRDYRRLQQNWSSIGQKIKELKTLLDKALALECPELVDEVEALA